MFRLGGLEALHALGWEFREMRCTFVVAVAGILLAARAPAQDEPQPFIIVMRNQVPLSALRQAGGSLDKPDRRRAVISLLKSTASQSQAALLAELRAARKAGQVGRRIEPLWLTNVIAAEIVPALANRISRRTDVARVVRDVRLVRDDFPVEPGGGPDSGGPDGPVECGVELIGAPRVWNELGITGRGSVVCVIDSGCCITHPDLINQIWVNADEIPNNGIDDDNNGFIDDIHGWNFSDGGNNDLSDPDGHGTHVSGIVAGDGSNGTTTGTAPGAGLMICRYWSGEAFESTVWAAMQYALDNGADVVTGSIGLLHRRNPSRALWRANCDNIMAAGVVVIYAAGNAGGQFPPFDNVATPADVPDVIAVGATDCNGFFVKFSSMGPVTWQDVPPYNDWPYPPGLIKPTVAAPGNEVRSTWNDCRGYGSMSGTSMSTPLVAGTVALMLEANPGLDHFEVKRILQETAVDMGEPGPDNIYGAGRLDAFAAVIAAQASACDACDMNCDGTVDASDIEFFIDILFNGRAPCATCTGDTNGDGRIDAGDIEGFIECLFP